MVLNAGDLNAGKKSFQLGIRLMFTGRASPAYRIRRSASPDDDTMSYWPPPPFFMSATISSELPAYFAFTWQPVCFSNGFTQMGFRYPSQAIRFSCPSPLPIFCRTGRCAVGTVSPYVPVAVPPEPAACEPPPLLPHPAARTATPASRSAVLAERDTARGGVVMVHLPLARVMAGPLRNRERLVISPGDAHPVPAGVARVGRGLRILPGDDKLASGVQVHDEPGQHAGVDDVTDPARLHPAAGRRLLTVVEQDDLLGSHGDPGAVPL